jgi:DNA-binding transcriptional ArsR family regulator
MANTEELSRIFSILSVSARLRILELVSDRALCVGALAARLGITPGAVSQHLRILREAGLVTAQRRGYFVHYHLNRDTLSRWQAILGEFWESHASQGPGEWALEGGGACAQVTSAVKSRKS